MTVLVSIRNSPPQMYLVKLFTDGLIEEIRDLIRQRKHSKAVVTVLTKGSFEREIQDREVTNVKADLILSKSNAMWDLT